MLGKVVAVALPLLGCVFGHSLTQQGTVYYDSETHQYSFETGVADPKGVAYGSFENTLNVTGWGVLRLTSNRQFDDVIQMHAAGYLEAVLTKDRIYEMSLSMRQEFFGKQKPPAALNTFFNTQDAWTRQQIQENPNDRVWIGISHILSQFDGLVEGYQSSQSTDKPLSVFDFQVLNGVGDLLDLMNVVGDHPIHWMNLTHDEFEDKLFSRSLCSALVKVTGDLSSLYFAHSSWFTYSAMNRIYKYYTFNLNTEYLAAKSMSFSSYPGFLESLDDFYMMSSGLSMIQTTNSVFNSSLYSYVQPQSLFAWQRVRLANAFAHNGRDWYELVSRYNSGTYNNQYMVIDLNLFTPHTPLLPNTLWVIEQIPGLVVGDDITSELERGYFPSYNVPYFEEIYTLSGYPDVVKKYGYKNSYQLAPRAMIFRRDQDKVVDMESLKAIMRYNNYETDPYSDHSASNAICSRGDLTKRARPGGCYDTKVSSDVYARQLTAFALNGPTVAGGASGALLPPFSWKSFESTAHFGQPEKFDFGFVKMTPTPEVNDTPFVELTVGARLAN